ncbi:MAG: acyl-CoA dehydrogenase family protein, partial [Alphaproteobacteria bacterium]
MDFNDTPEEAAFRSLVRAWLAANAQRRADGAVGGSILSLEATNAEAVARAKAWQKIKAAAGYAAVTWPVEYGGMGGAPMQGVIYSQEEAGFDVSSDLFVIGLGLAMPMLMALGSEAQKQRFIRPALEGREIWCQLFSEPGAGSDLAGVRTRAVKDGDDWVINGQKIWTSFGHLADWGILVARSDPAKPKHKGLSFFLLDMKSPGVTVRQIRQISGASGFNEVFFENVRIPENLRVGEDGDGWKAAITVLMNERVVTGNITGGGGVGEMIALARSTQTGDGPALGNAAVREKIADWHV